MVSYRGFTMKKLFTPEFSYLLLLIFWPLHGLVFGILEGLSRDYHVIHCALDDMIPFCEYFVVPYIFWFIFLAGMVFYSLLWDIPAFKKYMWFTIISYGMTLLIYIIYPSQQLLRPATFSHENLFTQLVSRLYACDTNTNVCPSLHVTGTLAVVLAAWDSKKFHTRGWRTAFCAAAVLIIASTVFLKQHSALDIFWSFLLCAVIYLVVFRLCGLCSDKGEKKNEKSRAASQSGATPGSENERSAQQNAQHAQEGSV